MFLFKIFLQMKIFSLILVLTLISNISNAAEESSSTQNNNGAPAIDLHAEIVETTTAADSFDIISLNKQVLTALISQNAATALSSTTTSTLSSSEGTSAPSSTTTSPSTSTNTPNTTTPAATITLSSAAALQYVTPVSEEDKAAAVQCHNNYRSQLALGNVFNKTGGNKMPMADSMLKIQWDDNLAKNAAEWANKCTISHSYNGWAGENLAMNGGTFTNKDAFLFACNGWWDELAKVGFYSDLVLRMDTFKAIGHWSQMAWANTFGIGCAVAQNCPNTNWKTYVVCWYYQPGNYVGAPVYEVGEPCSKCNATENKCDRNEGLCF